MSTTANTPPALAVRDGRSSDHTSKLLTAEQVAAKWQLPKSVVYRLTRDGQLPTVKIGRYYRYRLADVEQWEQNGGYGL
jgi:excisionase family DNA binding protein